jgi:hypothetical protein
LLAYKAIFDVEQIPAYVKQSSVFMAIENKQIAYETLNLPIFNN